MQRTWTNRIRIVNAVLFLLLILFFVAIDQFAKGYFKILDEKDLLGRKEVIKDFFYFTYLENTGAAYGFLGGKPWAQTFFKILTVLALIMFAVIFVYSIKFDYVFLSFSMALVIGGTVGNFIDRVLYSAVSDFLNLVVFGNDIFGVFNLADVFLCVGVFLFVIHCLFLDSNAIFRKNGNNQATDGKK